MHLNENLNFNVHCKCGGMLTFSVQSASNEKQYVCPNCSNDLTYEITPFIVNVKESLQLHCDSCQPLNNVKFIYLNGRLI